MEPRGALLLLRQACVTLTSLSSSAEPRALAESVAAHPRDVGLGRRQAEAGSGFCSGAQIFYAIATMGVKNWSQQLQGEEENSQRTGLPPSHSLMRNRIF